MEFIQANDDKFLDFAKGSKFKQCPKCQFWVEKNTGCNHMTCMCGMQFCYQCGGNYPKCECYMKQMESLQVRNKDKKKESKKRR